MKISEIISEGAAEGSDNLNYIGNCIDDDVIEHIFGDVTGFAQAVEEYGDEFVLDDLVVKYDPETDVHSFYYKKQGVAEAFNAPYKVKWDQDKGEAHYVDVTLPDGSQLDIRFLRDDGVQPNPDEWTVEFYRNDSQDLTGEGDAQRIFATVIKAIEKFIKIEKPKEITFAASRETDAGVKNQSRTNLYNRLIQRYAPGWGYDVKISNLKGTTGYKLFRRGKNQNVSEGELDEARKRKKKRKAKSKRHSSSNRSPVPRFYGAWGFGGEGEGDGGGE
jgi:hypothetical protein